MLATVALCGAFTARPRAAAAPLFRFVDVSIDPEGKPLAAYQVELKAACAPGIEAKVVGVEGGALAPFTDAPYYDPAALHREGRIVLASYSLLAAEKLPSAKLRVARVHFVVTGAGPADPGSDTPARPMPEFTVTLTTAATPQGAAIPARATAEGAAK
jgi:hypothetical protein